MRLIYAHSARSAPLTAPCSTGASSDVASGLPRLGYGLDEGPVSKLSLLEGRKCLRTPKSVRGPIGKRWWEFTPESGALGVARCPSGALSGALIRASSGTGWSRDLQVSRGQWPSPGRARAARKSCLMSTFCVRRSAGDSAAATGWSGQRRPIGPGVGTCPRPYRIVSVCRSAAAKHTRGSPTLCTRLERAGDQRAPLLTEPTPGPQQCR